VEQRVETQRKKGRTLGTDLGGRKVSPLLTQRKVASSDCKKRKGKKDLWE